MEHHYRESEALYERIHAQDPSNPQQFDQHLWMKEKSASRASFIMGMAGIEAFVNNVIGDFGVRGKEELPRGLLNQKQRKRPIEYWRLPDKVYFLPTLCNSELAPPTSYFNKTSEPFKLFEELVQIRNRIMHGRPDPFLGLIKLKPDKMHEVNDNFPENFWPLSKISKDFTSFNFESAKIAYENVVWVRGALLGFLQDVDEKYMQDEKIKLISPIIPDEIADEKELIENWQTYVTDGE